MSHMPELTARDVRRIVMAGGWELVRNSGSSHDQFKHPDKPNVVTIADHGAKSIPCGTLRSIFEAAGLQAQLKSLQKGTPLKHVEKQLGRQFKVG
jgi:predicted RNA binding protein YcfA (HicA-like mRNA interferase family)